MTEHDKNDEPHAKSLPALKDKVFFQPKIKNWILVIAKEFTKFGFVGAGALVVDVGLFNVFILSDMSTMLAKTISMSIAIIVAFSGNKLWAFKHRNTTKWQEQSNKDLGKEFSLFVFFNLIALGISLACLYISENILGLTSVFADNVSANFIGLGLGTLFRFYSYRRWVFPLTVTEEEKKSFTYSAEI